MGLARVCDVFKMAKDVRTFRVNIVEIDPGDSRETNIDWRRSIDWVGGHVDLCPRALVRLRAAIKVGMQPPLKRDRDKADEDVESPPGTPVSDQTEEEKAEQPVDEEAGI